MINALVFSFSSFIYNLIFKENIVKLVEMVYKQTTAEMKKMTGAIMLNKWSLERTQMLDFIRSIFQNPSRWHKAAYKTYKNCWIR